MKELKIFVKIPIIFVVGVLNMCQDACQVGFWNVPGRIHSVLRDRPPSWHGTYCDRWVDDKSGNVHFVYGSQFTLF